MKKFFRIVGIVASIGAVVAGVGVLLKKLQEKKCIECEDDELEDMDELEEASEETAEPEEIEEPAEGE